MKRLLLLVTLAIMVAMTLGTAVEAWAGKDDCPYLNDGFRNGTAEDDLMYGTPGPDKIRGCAGADEIHGQAGNDAIHGNGGPDKLYGEEGDDNLYGGGGNDTLYGGLGNDKLEGGDGNDKLYDNRGPLTGDPADTDILLGGAGNDTLDAHDGDELDTLDGGTNTPVSDTNRGDYCIGEVNDKYYDCEVGRNWTPSNSPNNPNQEVPWNGNNPS